MGIQISETEWAARCAEDGEFMLAARHWQGGLTLRHREEPHSRWELKTADRWPACPMAPMA